MCGGEGCLLWSWREDISVSSSALMGSSRMESSADEFMIVAI